ncbi:MAG: hypothetical protein GY906_23065 [bacterium]|nr:hypothetical protein [bacterium]
MKLFRTTKDGGNKSHVWAHTLIELKGLFSIILLRFEDGSREAYHTHAFNAVSWLLSGLLKEHRIGRSLLHRPSLKPIWTARDNMHKVVSSGRSWVLTFRGPWAPTWTEFNEKGKLVTLTHGRREVAHG